MSSAIEMRTVGLACAMWAVVGIVNPASAQDSSAARQAAIREIDEKVQNSPGDGVLFRAVKRDYPEVYARVLGHVYSYLIERKDDELAVMKSELQSFISDRRRFIEFAPDEKFTIYLKSAYDMMVLFEKENVTECVNFVRRPTGGLLMNSRSLSDQAMQAFFDYEAHVLDAAKAGEVSPVDVGELDQQDSEISGATASAAGLTPERMAALSGPGAGAASLAEKCSAGVAMAKFYAELPPQISRKILAGYNRKQTQSTINSSHEISR